MAIDVERSVARARETLKQLRRRTSPSGQSGSAPRARGRRPVREVGHAPAAQPSADQASDGG